MNSKYFILSLLLGVAACAVGPDYQRPETYNDEEIASSLKLNPAKAEAMRLNWYESFKDEGLKRLIAQGLSNSPNAKIASAKLRQARAQLKITGVADLPTFDADGSYHYSKVGKSSGYPFSTDYFQTGLDASWELDIWGANRRATESAAALYKAAAADVDNVNLSLTAEIAMDYINLRMYQEQVRISEQNLKLQQDIYDIVKAKYDAGLENEASLKQAEYAVASTKSLLPELKNQVEAYQNALAVLTGELPGNLNTALAPEEKNIVRRSFKLNLNKLYELPVNVVRLRPDVRIAEYQLISKNAKVGEAIAALYPNVSISGFLGYQSQKIPSLIGGDSFGYNYAPVINLPLLHWGALTNNVDLQKAVAEEYVYQYQNALLSAASEIKNAYSGIEKGYEKNRASREAVIAQKQVLDLTLTRYREGLTEFNTVLTAEQNLLSSQNAFIESNGNIYQNIIGFYKAVGGGYNENVAEQIRCLDQLDGQCGGTSSGA